MPRMAIFILVLLVGCQAPRPSWEIQLDGRTDGHIENLNISVTIKGN